MLKNRNKIALSYTGIQYTYTQLLQYAYIYSEAFSAEREPSKILICADNSPEWCFALYGALRSKAIVVPVDTQSTKSEIEYIINDCTPDVLFISDEKRELFESMDLHGAKLISPSNINTNNIDNVEAQNIPMGIAEDTIFIIHL